jgi:hypothetical protein
MSDYLTIERFKERVEERYKIKRQNTLIPRDKEKKILFLIDDIHLSKNLKFDFLEFVRGWCLNGGYYDV